jgi:riboflavin synthase
VAGHSRRQAPEEDAVFTGIVEELGEVVRLEHSGDSARLIVRGPKVTSDAATGDSIAINGVCLTVTQTQGAEFTADVMGETLKHSTIGSFGPGTAVNLERAVRPDGRLGGHIVQGHADGTGTIVSRLPGTDWDVVRIAMPTALARYVVYKGSVAVDGVSLTISGLSEAGDSWFEVSLIPETLARTTLGFQQPGAAVNLEVDVIAKYVERLVAATAQQGSAR